MNHPILYLFGVFSLNNKKVSRIIFHPQIWLQSFLRRHGRGSILDSQLNVREQKNSKEMGPILKNLSRFYLALLIYNSLFLHF